MKCPSVCPTTSTRAVRRFLRGERGISLVELLVVIPMSAVSLIGMYGLYNLGAKDQGLNTGRAQALLRAQNGLERMTREMRQALTVNAVSSQVLDAETYVRPPSGATSVEKHVRYECLSGTCTRYEGPANGTTYTLSEVIVRNVQNADNFLLQTDTVNPKWVVVRLEVKPTGFNNPIVLSGGFAFPQLPQQDGGGA